MKEQIGKFHDERCERKGKKGKKQSAAADLQQTSIGTCASNATGYEMALIFNGQTANKDGKQRAAKQRRKLGREGERVHGEIW